MFDAFLTHDWGMDELGRDNHTRVSRINTRLRNAGFNPWFDEEQMGGDVQKMMADSIEQSRCLIVFVTNRYIIKASGNDEKTGANDNCRFEFYSALHSQHIGAAKMIPVVMEPRCKNTSAWPHGTVKGFLSASMYIDLSMEMSTSAFEEGIKALMAEIVAVTGIAPSQYTAQLQSEGKIDRSSMWPPPLNVPEAIEDGKGGDIPEYFLCPITSCIMRNPAMTPDGVTYDHEAIVGWLETKGVCPSTNLPLKVEQLAPNRSVRSMIEDFVKRAEQKVCMFFLMGAGNISEIRVEAGQTISLGRANLPKELQAAATKEGKRSNVSREQAALRANEHGELTVKSRGANPTGFLSKSGQAAGGGDGQTWHKLLNGETADLCDGDQICLDITRRAETLYTVKATSRGLDAIAAREKELAAAAETGATPRGITIPKLGLGGSGLGGAGSSSDAAGGAGGRKSGGGGAEDGESLATRMARRRVESALRRELESPRGQRQTATIDVGARVIVKRSSGEEAHAIVDAFDARRGLYKIALVPEGADPTFTPRNTHIAADQYKMVTINEMRLADGTSAAKPKIQLLGKVPMQPQAAAAGEDGPTPRASCWAPSSPADSARAESGGSAATSSGTATSSSTPSPPGGSTAATSKPTAAAPTASAKKKEPSSASASAKPSGAAPSSPRRSSAADASGGGSDGRPDGTAKPALTKKKTSGALERARRASSRKLLSDVKATPMAMAAGGDALMPVTGAAGSSSSSSSNAYGAAIEPVAPIPKLRLGDVAKQAELRAEQKIAAASANTTEGAAVAGQEYVNGVRVLVTRSDGGETKARVHSYDPAKGVYQLALLGTEELAMGGGQVYAQKFKFAAASQIRADPDQATAATSALETTAAGVGGSGGGGASGGRGASGASSSSAPHVPALEAIGSADSSRNFNDHSTAQNTARDTARTNATFNSLNDDFFVTPRAFGEFEDDLEPLSARLGSARLDGPPPPSPPPPANVSPAPPPADDAAAAPAADDEGAFLTEDEDHGYATDDAAEPAIEPELEPVMPQTDSYL